MLERMSLHASTNGGSVMATTPTKQQPLLPLLKHVEAFAKIVNVSQTQQLHEWNVESLQRALQWAQFLERGTRRYGAQQQLQLDALLRETFPTMTLPSFAKGDVLTTHALQHGTCVIVSIAQRIRMPMRLMRLVPLDDR